MHLVWLSFIDTAIPFRTVGYPKKGRVEERGEEGKGPPGTRRFHHNISYVEVKNIGFR